jgi:hypothetical protein
MQVLQRHNNNYYEVITLYYNNNNIMILCTLYNVIQIYADFDATSDKPKQFEVQVDIGHCNYRYCYLNTTNNGVAFQRSPDAVTYKNQSRKIIVSVIA